jgi:hypothetical protein
MINIVLLIATVRRLNLGADCQRPELPALFMLGLIAKSGGLQPAVHLTTVCQGLIIVVANHKIGDRDLAVECNPLHVILHLQTLRLNRYKLFMCAKQCSGLLGLNYRTMVSVDTLSCDTVLLEGRSAGISLRLQFWI